MNEKFKKILKLTGIGAIGFILGMGFLAGVSMCSNNGKKEKSNTSLVKQLPLFNLNNRVNSSTTLTADMLNQDINILLTAKNAEQNGAGVWYTGDTITPYTATSIEPSSYQQCQADIIIQNGEQNIAVKLGFVINIMNQPYKRYITYCYLENNSGTQYDIFVCNSDSGSFNKLNSSLLVKRITFVSEGAYTLINQFFDIYTFGDYTYTMPIQPNANAQLGFSSQSFLVRKTGVTDGYFFQDIYTGYFKSNGLVFDTIRTLFITGRDIRYKNDKGDIVINQTNNDEIFFFAEILYVNSITNNRVIVYERLQSTFTDSNGESHHYWDNIFTWRSAQYRVLDFAEVPDTVIITSLDVFSSENNNIIYNDTINGGLGGAMGLFSEAFSGVINLFSIEVFPNISLGILVFLPLIAGIIVAIIWVLKR